MKSRKSERPSVWIRCNRLSGELRVATGSCCKPSVTSLCALYRAYATALLVGLCLSGAGCSRSVFSLDAEEGAESDIRDARGKYEEGKITDAIDLYRSALDRNALLARAHLDIALLLHDYQKDYVRAIYHYQRYLELRPKTEKRAMIVNRIRLAKHLFVATTANRGKTVGSDVVKLAASVVATDWDSIRSASMLRIERLEKENERLRRRVSELETM